MIFLTKRFLPADLVTHLWGFGRTDVKRIKTSEFNYLLKYVTKGPTLPDWVLQMPRLRIFQSSRGFLKPLPKTRGNKEAQATQKTHGIEHQRTHLQLELKGQTNL
jgi:hypothetical protein